MEKLAHDLSERISLQMNYDEDKKAVIAYGLTSILQLCVIGFAISVIGILCHMFVECLVAFVCVGVLKKSTGGAHSDSIYICTFISISMILLFAAASRYLFSLQKDVYINFGIVAGVFSISFLVFYKRVPIDSPNKRITRTEKIRRLRRQSFLTLAFYMAAAFIFVRFASVYPRLLTVAFSLLLAVCWQTLMLTKIGSKFIKLIDTIFLKEASP